MLAEEHGRVAVVLAVPFQVCRSCGSRTLSNEDATRLERILTDLLCGPAEVSVARWTVDAPTGPPTAMGN
jgi:hypothetical protein